MKWEQTLHSGMIYLNQYFLNITSEATTLQIHYWGAQEKLTTNHFHQHSFFEICYVMDGRGFYLEKDELIPLEKGTLFLSTPYTKHQIISKEGLSILFIGFDLKTTTSDEIRELFDAISKDDNILLIKDVENTGILHLWISILKLAENTGNGFINTHFNLLIIMLICNLIGEFQEENVDEEAQKVSTATNIIYMAKMYIKNNLPNSFVLADVANAIHISERHLSRLFQQELGQTFSSFVKKERIRKAGIKLAETNSPIKDIAENVGFNNVHYFSKVFSEEMDMPPGKFRNKFQLNIKS